MKNKSVIAFIVLLIGSFLSGYYGPWWAPAVFIVISAAILNLSIKEGMSIGSLALMITFMGMAVWMRAHDHSRLIEKTGTLLGGLSPVGMVAVTSFIGLVTGFLAGWLGSSLSGMLKSESKAGAM